MQTIRLEFNAQAWQLIQSHESASESDTEAEGIGDLTLEMTDNPFDSLMRKIDKLLDAGLEADLVQAFHLARAAILDGVFDDRFEQKLSDKLEQIIETIHAERELSNAFTKSVLDIQPVQQYAAPIPSYAPDLAWKRAA